MEETLNFKDFRISSGVGSGIQKGKDVERKLYCAICNMKVSPDGESGIGACPIHGWIAIVFSEESSEEIF